MTVVQIDMEVTLYGLADSHGNTWAGVADDGNHVTVYGLFDKDGDRPLEFSGNAGGLEEWALEKGLRYDSRENTVWVSVGD